MLSEDFIHANGLDGDTGEYLLPPIARNDLAALASGEKVDPFLLADVQAKAESGDKHYGAIAGVDCTDIASAGWAVIFPADTDPAIVEALVPLLEHRQAKAASKDERLYRICMGPESGYAGQRCREYLNSVGAPGVGDVDPAQFPFFVLLVGDPKKLPFSFQYQLDLQYAVGRIHFDKPEDYAQYAKSVVEAETGKLPPRQRRAAFFAPANPGDKSTGLSSRLLTAPLAEYFRSEKFTKDVPNWTVSSDIAAPATRARLTELLGGSPGSAPDFLFAACHGMGYKPDNPRQREFSGALTCQDWGGKDHVGPIRDVYFAAEDLSSSANVAGMIAMLFACYGAGVPRLDDFFQKQDARVQRRQIANDPFLSALPKRMLTHPKGGALAVVGHVDRAWDYSYRGTATIPQTGTFQSIIQELFIGYPVGAAMERMNRRYADLEAQVNGERNAPDDGRDPDPALLAELWCMANDARNYVVIGDPAVRLT